MARVMSLVFMTFMLVPVLAPNIGQLILLFAPWRAIFLVLAVYARDRCSPGRGSGCRRRCIPSSAARSTGGRWRARSCETVREPQSRGYTLALTVSFSGAGRLHLLDPADRLRRLPRGPVSSASSSRRSPRRWRSPPGSTRGSSAASDCAGSAIAAALAFALITAVHAAIALAGFETLAAVHRPPGADDGCFAFTSSNLGTLAMEQYGADRRHRLVGPGHGRHHRRGGDRLPHRPAVRRHARCRSCVGTAACAAGGFLADRR